MISTRDDFGFDATGPIDDEDYLLSQLRLNVEWEPTRWASPLLSG